MPLFNLFPFVRSHYIKYSLSPGIHISYSKVKTYIIDLRHFSNNIILSKERSKLWSSSPSTVTISEIQEVSTIADCTLPLDYNPFFLSTFSFIHNENVFIIRCFAAFKDFYIPISLDVYKKSKLYLILYIRMCFLFFL